MYEMYEGAIRTTFWKDLENIWGAFQACTKVALVWSEFGIGGEGGVQRVRHAFETR